MTHASDLREGWHTIGDGSLEVWVEKGRVTRGTFNGIVPVYPYRFNAKLDVWERHEPTLSTLRRALKEGSMRMI